MRIGSRRDALRGFGAACAVASFPIAFAASAKAAFAQDGGALPEEVVDVLNFALTLEYLENSFYEKALATDGLIPDTNNNRQIFETIQDHEAEHVEFLESTLGDKAVEKPTFDFTAGGTFDTFQTYQTFLLLSQAFEDTGVRAYRRQAGALAGSPKILTAALTIHSVEARHAANVRLLRDLTGWIPQDQPEAPAAAKAVYAGMDQTTKYKIDVPDVAGIEPVKVTEAFDEPLSKKAVLAIAGQFTRAEQVQIEMSEFLNDVPKSVDEQHRGQSAAARRQRVGGAAAALGSTGMPAWANDAQAQPPTSKLDDPPNTLETIANAAATAEVLTTIVNTVGPEHVALDEQTRLNVRAAALEEKIHYEVLISDAVA